MEDASAELSNAPRMSVAATVATIVLAFGGLLTIGLLTYLASPGEKSPLPPPELLTFATATEDPPADQWQREWAEISPEAWRAAAPAFEYGIVSRTSDGPTPKLEMKLDFNSRRFSLTPVWEGGQPFFIVGEDADFMSFRRMFPVDPEKFRLACEGLRDAARASKKRFKPAERLKPLTEATTPASGATTGEATPAATAN